MRYRDEEPTISLEQWREEREADEAAKALKVEALRLLAEQYVNEPEPATILMSLVLDEGLPFGTAQAIYRRRFGAETNLQDAAEREAREAA